MALTILSTIPFDEPSLAKIRAALPADAALHVQQVKSATEIQPELWQQVDILYTGHVLPEPGSAPNLKWIQSHFAGVDSYLDSGLFNDHTIALTTLSGAAVPQIGEYVLTMLLAMGHKLPQLMEHQKRADWPKDRHERFSPMELSGRTVGLIGYGSIGREIARVLSAFGCTILATKANAMQPAEGDYTRPGRGDPDADHATRIYPPQAMYSMLGLCDFAVVTVPLTNATRGLFNQRAFAALKPGAYLVFVSRGEVYEEKDLLAALNDGNLAGVALDVFPQEPLPKNSPLWAHPNVIISPHICGISPNYPEDAAELFSENLKIYLSGGRLLNRFDPARGY